MDSEHDAMTRKDGFELAHNEIQQSPSAGHSISGDDQATLRAGDDGLRVGQGKTLRAEGAHTREVFNAEMFAAVQASPIERWSRASMMLYLAIFTSFLCACANGYDGTLMTALIAMPYFQSTFQSGTTGATVALIFSMYQVGTIAASPLAAILSDRFGRRKAMFAGATVILIGMAIATSAEGIPQLVVGRVVLGGGVAFVTVCAPAYATECSPPHWRGRAVGFYNTGWFGGSIPAAAICFGTSYIQSNMSWRIPLLLQAYACVFIMVFVFIIPESPRFHMANGRDDLAHAFLVKYHGNGDPSSALVALEMEEMRRNIRVDGIDKRWWDYRPLFSTHGGRWRMLQVIMMGVAGQFSGNGLGYFNTVIYEQLGVTTVALQLAYNLINSIVSAISAWTGVALTDRMPRRKVLVFGSLGCAVWLAINAGLSAVLDQQTRAGSISKSVAQAALAAYFLFNCQFSFTYTPLQGLYPTENLETTMRAKGLAVSNVINNGIGFINQFAGPIALGNIQYKYIFVFVGFDVFAAGMWYLFGVESNGRTLEQLDWIYEQPNPVKASIKVDKVVVQSDGAVTEVLEE